MYKSCPFCGGAGEPVAVGKFYRIECTACEAFTGLAKTIAGAWEKWNRRAPTWPVFADD
jgi:hypothetical protein